MVEELGVSTPHLTYHLENLGELVSKMDDGQYKLSAFGLATVGAMKGVEDIRESEPKTPFSDFKVESFFRGDADFGVGFVRSGWFGILLH